ncbi:hypothetical protein RRG08_001733 [Elysia crispata]|uniref:Uncharacterized protein n=1 Tax=Elysia crispata TaxID=231223 RepID=A0AAE1E0R9_9GAST|nr:hypothetical protein RRG08_001733 [Elysia crispata]
MRTRVSECDGSRSILFIEMQVDPWISRKSGGKEGRRCRATFVVTGHEDRRLDSPHNLLDNSHLTGHGQGAITFTPRSAHDSTSLERQMTCLLLGIDPGHSTLVLYQLNRVTRAPVLSQYINCIFHNNHGPW